MGSLVQKDKQQMVIVCEREETYLNVKKRNTNTRL